MEKCQGWALSGHVATYTNKNAVQNVDRNKLTEHFT